MDLDLFVAASCFTPDSPFSWELCCRPAVWGVQGVAKCWDGDFTFDSCCTLWPGNQLEYFLPFRGEPMIAFGVAYGDILRANQVIEDQTALFPYRIGSPPEPRFVGGLLWPDGAVLARWAADTSCAGPKAWKGLRVLELAAGIGLPSMVVKHFGANVTASDFSGAALIALTKNVGTKRSLLNIFDEYDETVRRFSGTFDIVMGAAIFHRSAPDAIPIAIRLIEKMLKPCAESKVFLLAADHLIDHLEEWERNKDLLSEGKGPPLVIARRHIVHVPIRGKTYAMVMLKRPDTDHGHKGIACQPLQPNLEYDCAYRLMSMCDERRWQ